MPPIRFLYFFLLASLCQKCSFGAKRGRGKGNKKNLVNIPNVIEYSKIPEEPLDPEGATITRASHFHQPFKLGYKIVLICVAEGPPPLTIKWYRDGLTITMRRAIHLTTQEMSPRLVQSRFEIDPALIGDAGVYTCIANNKKTAMAKSFKVEYFA